MVVVSRLGFVGLLALTAVMFFGPRPDFDDRISFDSGAIGPDIDAYLAAAEAAVPDLRPGAEKQVIWRDPVARDRTGIALVYLHGFSATKQETRPLSDHLAARLDANLFYTRFTGHGRDGPALGAATAQAWHDDLAEAVAIGARLGERVILIGVSTGGSLATLAAAHPALKEDVDGVVLISPNFGQTAMGSGLLTIPFGEAITHAILGDSRAWDPRSAEQARWWTTSYPVSALFPMAMTAKAAAAAEVEDVRIPALFIYSEDDRIVNPARTRAVAEDWRGPVEVVTITPGPDDDPDAHVIAGDILSPGLTPDLTARIVTWVEAQGLR